MPLSKQARPAELLLVEDNPGDVRLTIEAFRDSKLLNHLSVVTDGVEALAFLRQEGLFSEALRPDIVLLDLNLPKKDGREVLAEVKADDRLKNIPIVILTSSQAERDVLGSYELHANCYVTKPVDFHEFLGALRSIETFWLTVVTLPSESELP